MCRVFSIALVAIMLFALLPVQALAEDGFEATESNVFVEFNYDEYSGKVEADDGILL